MMLFTQITRCPHCETSFRVGDEQLDAANGYVRCGSCLQVFKATDYFITDEAVTEQNQPTSAIDEPSDESIVEKVATTPKAEQQLDDLEPSEQTEPSEPSAQALAFTLADDDSEEDKINDKAQIEDFESLSASQSEEQQSVSADYLADFEDEDNEPSFDPDDVLLISDEGVMTATEADQTDETHFPTTSEDISQEPIGKEGFAMTASLSAEPTIDESIIPGDLIADDQNEAMDVEKSVDQPKTPKDELIADKHSEGMIEDDLTTLLNDVAVTTDDETFSLDSLFENNQHDVEDDVEPLIHDDMDFKEAPDELHENTELSSPSEDLLTLDELNDLVAHDTADILASSTEDQDDSQFEDKWALDLIDDDIDQNVINDDPTVANVSIDSEIDVKDETTTHEFDYSDGSSFDGTSDAELPDGNLKFDQGVSLNIPTTHLNPLELGETKPSPRTGLWTVAAILLIIALVFQIAWFRMGELARLEQFRPAYIALCEFARCEIPNLQNVEQVKVTNTVFNPHRSIPGIIVVDTLITNTASHKQPYPDLELEFRDLNDNIVAQRIFAPKTYLAGDVLADDQMPSQIPIHIALELVNPGLEAVTRQIYVRPNQ